MANPLNPLLYGKLERVFGRVIIANEGQAMLARYAGNPTAPRGADGQIRQELVISNPGEYYKVNCNKCNDTRHRLWFNHRWGVQDEQGRRNLWLAVCYNEGCYGNYEELKELLDEMSGLANMSHRDILPGKKVTGTPDLQMPGPTTPLHKLPADHPANAYLASRYYDPEQLGRFYGVGYCHSSDYYLARNRIIAPVYQIKDGVVHLKGWQARHIGEADWHVTPKWWTSPGMKKSHLLYNLPNARLYRTGVVVEGPGDVWGFGPMACATFGSSLGQEQERQLAKAFEGLPLVFLWDSDVQQDATKKAKYDDMIDRLSNSGSYAGVASVILPEGTDPGSLDRQCMRPYVAAEALKQGVKTDWRRR